MATSQKYVDINSASAADLQTLPGIGPIRAKAVIKARTVSINNCSFKMEDYLTSCD